MSDLVAKYISDMLDQYDGYAEIQRNLLAGQLGCVPSQINYVITSRFTPEQGYIVESKRGGGGYIRITRIKMDKSSSIMHIINSIGSRLSFAGSNAILNNLRQQDILSDDIADLMYAVLLDRAYASVPPECRDSLRASLFKNMLLTQV